MENKNNVITMTNFNHYQATEKLKELAKKPFDLAKEGNLSSSRIKTMYAEACGFKLLYGTERITTEVVETLNTLAIEAQAIEKMEKMQSGEIMNVIEGFPSENRPVLHTAMRDFFENPNNASAAKQATELAKKEHEKLKAFLTKIEKTNQFTDLVAIAIGGSDLGPRSVYTALKYFKKPGRNIHFIGNIDPDDAASVFRGLDLKKTLVLIVSKSGSTLETVTNEAFARKFFEKANLKPEEHFITATGKGSPLDNPSKYLECFYFWDYVGGRFSTTSMAGGVLLSFALGYDKYYEFLKGASAMDKIALNPDLRINLPLLEALLGIWNRNFLANPTVALIPYSQALSRFSAHIQQVDMESNGKHIDHHGNRVEFDTSPIVWGEPGTCAQHSFYQMIHQGTSIVSLELIGFKESQENVDIEVKGTTSQEKLLSNLIAQAIALAQGQKSDNPNREFLGNRPSRMLLGKQLTPYSMGALFALYEHKIAFQGFIWGINSFDQEGVQLGKVLAEKMIGVFAEKRKKQKVDHGYPLGEAFLDQLDSI